MTGVHFLEKQEPKPGEGIDVADGGPSVDRLISSGRHAGNPSLKGSAISDIGRRPRLSLLVAQ
jgi:hypothetical protein